MQSAAPVQLTQVPPKPTWRNYNQTVLQRTREELQREELQLYVDRQKELASTQATAPLQQLITDLNKLAADQQAQIKRLSDQIQSDATAAIRAKSDYATAVLQAKAAAHTEGLQQGAGIGVGATLLLFGLVFGVRRLTRNFTVTKKPQARAASA
jgi:flagellar biosynthesis/type III secretory pathway protein FliH